MLRWLFDILREELEADPEYMAACKSKGSSEPDRRDHPAYDAVCKTFKAFAKLLLSLLDEEDYEVIQWRYAAYDQLSKFSAKFDKQRNLPLWWNASSTEGFEDVVDVARNALIEYNGLKDEKRMHLLMAEFGRKKCKHLEDVLLLDAVKQIEIKELINFPKERLNNLIGSELLYLRATKYKTIEFFSECVTDPLRPMWLGSFSEEVLDVVRSANFRRRAQDAEKVGVEHLALATVWEIRGNLSLQEFNVHDIGNFLELEMVEKFLEDVDQGETEPGSNEECMGLVEGPDGISFFDICPVGYDGVWKDSISSIKEKLQSQRWSLSFP